MENSENDFFSSSPFIVIFMLIFFMVLTPGNAVAQEDIQAMRNQLEEQGNLIQKQQEELQIQQQKIDQQIQDQEQMRKQLEEMEKALDGGEYSLMDQPQISDTKKKAIMSKNIGRDGVGDLNREAVKAGDFPGSFTVPGTGNISLAIGGFIKTVAIYDSNAERMGAAFLPAILGTQRPDDSGSFALDATLSRLYFDARAPARSGQLRGRVEYDFNNKNDGTLDVNMRFAYGTWDNDYGTLTFGHTWSTLMDVKILPEGLTEPTVSGAIFTRQAIIRWSQPFGEGFTYHAAIENPNSNDVFSDEPTLGNTNVPDCVLGIEHVWDTTGHLRLNGILRDIEVKLPDGGDASETGWGVSLSGRLNILEKDRIVFSTVYGEGLGRYLLGIPSTAGSTIDLEGKKLKLRENWGWVLSYQHYWTDTLRSSAMVGYAESEDFSQLRGNDFDNSIYTAGNLMWSVLPYMTMGIEYAYGKREDNDNSDIDNHRITFGIQVF